MNYVVKVKYKTCGNPDLCYTNLDNLKIGDYVIGESELGLELGLVISNPVEQNLQDNLYKIITIAKKEEIEAFKIIKKNDIKILIDAQEEADKLKLAMDFFKVEHSIDDKKIRLSYTSTQNKVDFRSLLPILKQKLNKDIRLNQVSSRDKAKNVGGLGICGRVLCCSSFLNNFETVTMNNAKTQQLPLNAQKLSGACGKLMCCLLFENETYLKESQAFPKINSFIYYNNQQYKVLGFNVISKQIKLSNKDGVIFIKLADLSIKDSANEKSK